MLTLCMHLNAHPNWSSEHVRPPECGACLCHIEALTAISSPRGFLAVHSAHPALCFCVRSSEQLFIHSPRASRVVPTIKRVTPESLQTPRASMTSPSLACPA